MGVAILAADYAAQKWNDLTLARKHREEAAQERAQRVQKQEELCRQDAEHAKLPF